MTVEPTTIQNGQGTNPGNGARQPNRNSVADETGSLLPFAFIMGNARQTISQDTGKPGTDSPGEEEMHESSGREGAGAVKAEAVTVAGTEHTVEKTDLPFPGKNVSHSGQSLSFSQPSVAPAPSEEKTPVTGRSVPASTGFRSQGEIKTGTGTTHPEQKETGVLKTALQNGASQPGSVVNPGGDGETEGKPGALVSGGDSGGKTDAGMSGEPVAWTGGSVSGTAVVPSPGEAVPGGSSQGKGGSPGRVGQKEPTAPVLKNGMPSSGVGSGGDDTVPMSTRTVAGTGQSLTDTPSVSAKGGNTSLNGMQGVNVSSTEVGPDRRNAAMAGIDMRGGSTQLESHGVAFQENTIGEKAGEGNRTVPAGGTGGEEKTPLSRWAGRLAESSKGDAQNAISGKSGTDLSPGAIKGTAHKSPVAEDVVATLQTRVRETSEAVKGRIARDVAKTGTENRVTGDKPDPSGSPLQDASTARQNNIAGKNGAEKTAHTAGKDLGAGNTENRPAGGAESTSSNHEQKGHGRFEERTVESVQRGPSRSTSPSQENSPSGGYQQVASLAGEKPVVAAEHAEITPRGLIDQIADGAKTSGRVRIALNPPSLGTLDMDVLVRDNKVHVILQAENVDVKQVLQSNMDNLRTALRSQGLTVDSIQVLTQEKGDGEGLGSGRNDFWSGEGSNSSGGNRREWNGGDVDLSASVPPLQETETQQVAHDGGLNVFA